MPSKFFKQMALLAKMEVTYGVDSVPTGPANAIQTVDCTISEFEGPTETMDVDRPSWGNGVEVHVGIFTKITFKVPMAGAGAAGTAPKYGPLIRMCGHSETITALTKVEYKPVSTGLEAGSFYYNIGTNLHKLLGVRGNMKLSPPAAKIPYFEFEFWGLRVDITEAALPADVDYSGFLDPEPVNDANTPTFTLFGTAVNMIDFSYDCGNKLVYRNVVGTEAIEITDRAPKASVTFEELAIATLNVHALTKAGTTGAVQMVHGLTGGKIIQIDIAKAQPLKPEYVDSDGILAVKLGLNSRPNSSAGNDEHVITIK